MKKRLTVELEVVCEVEGNPDPPVGVGGADPTSGMKLADDLTYCNWGEGKSRRIFWFTPQQGKAFKVLWDALREGMPDRHQNSILRHLGSGYAKLGDLFRGHPCWGLAIRPSTDFGGKVGCYRLAVPSA